MSLFKMWYVHCDIQDRDCIQQGPWGDDVMQARKLAKASGWHRLNGTRQDVCPNCWIRRVGQ